MDKVIKLFLNSLRCPICRSQVDLINIVPGSGRRSSSNTPLNYGCASNMEHYRFWLPTQDPPPYIANDRVITYENDYYYQIDQTYPPAAGTYYHGDTFIFIRKTDAEHRILDKSPTKSFKYDKPLFDWKKANREKLINKIKTILTFQ